MTVRLEMWKSGDIDYLLNEGKEIQKRLIKRKRKNKESDKEVSLRLMPVGKAWPATKLINESDAITGVHKFNDEIKEALSKKHPKPEAASSEVMLRITRLAQSSYLRTNNGTECPENRQKPQRFWWPSVSGFRLLEML